MGFCHGTHDSVVGNGVVGHVGMCTASVLPAMHWTKHNGSARHYTVSTSACQHTSSSSHTGVHWHSTRQLPNRVPTLVVWLFYAPSMHPLCTLYTPSRRPLCALYAPTMCPLGTHYAPSMRPLCALYAPSMHPLCAPHAPSMRPLCAHYAPSLRPLCTHYALGVVVYGRGPKESTSKPGSTPANIRRASPGHSTA